MIEITVRGYLNTFATMLGVVYKNTGIFLDGRRFWGGILYLKWPDYDFYPQFDCNFLRILPRSWIIFIIAVTFYGIWYVKIKLTAYLFGI